MISDSHDQGGPNPMTRTEAIRRAIDVLGPDAQVPHILDYVWEQFGIGVPPKQLAPDANPARFEPAPLAGNEGAPQFVDEPETSGEVEQESGRQGTATLTAPAAIEVPETETDSARDIELEVPPEPAPAKKPAGKRARTKDRPQDG